MSATLLTATLPCVAQQTDISFLVAGKTANYRQWTKTFLQEGGKVQAATLLAPLTERAMAFTDGGYALKLHGGRYSTEAELEAVLLQAENIYQLSVEHAVLGTDQGLPYHSQKL